MSQTICYRPLNKGSSLNNISAPSSFRESLEKAFGGWPLRLTDTDIPKLEGMASICSTYQQIIDLIEKYDEIELYSEF